jgi:hypothetical protein
MVPRLWSGLGAGDAEEVGDQVRLVASRRIIAPTDSLRLCGERRHSHERPPCLLHLLLRQWRHDWGKSPEHLGLGLVASRGLERPTTDGWTLLGVKSD